MSDGKWKTIGTHVITLGISWLVKRYVAKKLPPAVVEVLGAAANGAPVPAEVAAMIEVIKKAHFDAELAKLLDAAEKAEKGIGASLDKNDRLLAAAAAARAQARKR